MNQVAGNFDREVYYLFEYQLKQITIILVNFVTNWAATKISANDYLIF